MAVTLWRGAAAIGMLAGVAGAVDAQSPSPRGEAPLMRQIAVSLGEVPPPALWALSILGVGGIGGMVRRRRLPLPPRD